MNRLLSQLTLLLVLSSQVMAQKDSGTAQGVQEKAFEGEHTELQHQINQLQQENQQLEQLIGRQEREISRLIRDIQQNQHLLNRLDEFSDELQENLLPLRQQIPYAPESTSRSQTEILDSPIATERFLSSLSLWTNELDQSTSLHAWEGALPSGKQVEFIRLGRVGLYYLTPDSNDAAMFNPETGLWKALSLSETREVVRARDIAKGYRKPDWLYLPILGITQDAHQTPILLQGEEQ